MATLASYPLRLRVRSQKFSSRTSERCLINVPIFKKNSPWTCPNQSSKRPFEENGLELQRPDPPEEHVPMVFSHSSLLPILMTTLSPLWTGKFLSIVLFILKTFTNSHRMRLFLVLLSTICCSKKTQLYLLKNLNNLFWT